MKRSYDYSFVKETDDITSTINPHSISQYIATQATHPSIGHYPTVPANPLLGQYGILGSAFELRVPLLAGAVGFNPDFQSNTALLHANLQPRVSGPHLPSEPIGSCSRPSGLGILYEYPSSDAAHISPCPAEHQASQSKPSCSGLLGASLDTLSLHDICHVDSSPVPTSAIDITDSSLAYGLDPFSQYSSQTFTSHRFTHSSSIASLCYPSGSDSSLTDGLDWMAAKREPQSFLEFRTPPLQSRDSLEFLSQPLVGIFADINMRELAVKLEAPEAGVNPADIMGELASVKLEQVDHDDSSGSSVQESPVIDHLSENRYDADVAFPDDAINTIVSVLTASKREVDAMELIASQSEPVLGESDVFDHTFPVRTALTAPNVISTSVPLISPTLPILQPPGRSPLTDTYSTNLRLDTCLVVTASSFVKQQSPVLNAHLGIELDDLRRRADDFRRNNPGIDIDKTWLQAYAGRLSQRGELLEDYRCYVVGCAQRNKRRDHILVHVGSHVEHRPFQCVHCGMRFLRKNECKRHESSHGGRKPFQCPICAPIQDRSFVRQDLLKRHMRVTHGVQSESAVDRRKKIKLTAEEEYWP
ncbi:uncharacterized protein FIBRA_01460 [Fibroporia radiculosa]|uniref:C2H2-type domain-containing protein n=1 Tax=Fibroporia radiculosa TaxID=599839 RepID=J4HTD8_9APHY|nr:uncharacterized protein FIBRA_01460 [Fibroporia radiculosa]CCL99442.1 predicted protein [Fibroporia radiculosa]